MYTIRDRRAFAAFVRALARRAGGMSYLARQIPIARSRLYEWCEGRRRALEPDTARALYQVALWHSNHGDGFADRLRRALRAPQSPPPDPAPRVVRLSDLRPSPRMKLSPADHVAIEKARRAGEPVILEAPVRVTPQESAMLWDAGFVGKVTRDANGTLWATSDVTFAELEAMAPEERKRASGAAALVAARAIQRSGITRDPRWVAYREGRAQAAARRIKQPAKRRTR